MKLEVGKRYLTRDGRVTGPLQCRPSKKYPFMIENKDGFWAWMSDGSYFSADTPHCRDLVAEAPAPDLAPGEATREWQDEGIALVAEGRKDDTGKAPWHLLAPEFMEGTAQVLAFGAVKYEERNWERGMKWSRPFSAMMRHMWAWWRGEKVDPETGHSHLWHAACCVMFLVAYEQRGVGKDDRPS